MNEPYNRVNTQEENNSTLYRNIGIQVGLGVAIQGAQEGALQLAHRRTSNPLIKQTMDDVLYRDSNVKEMGLVNPFTGTDYYDRIKEGKIKSTIGKMPVFGQSTLKGRAFNYGGALVGGIIGGAIQTKVEEGN